MKTITATEANRNFAKILDEARRGETYVVTSHGKAAVRISPAAEEMSEEERERRRRSLREYLDEVARRPVQKIGRWTRDELYDDD